MPVIAQRDHYGLGIFWVSEASLPGEVEYIRIEGFGAIFSPFGLSLGYADRQVVTAPLVEDGYRVATPLAEIAVGQKSLDAARELIGHSVFSQ